MHNVRRQTEASRVRMNRVLTGYVHVKHPVIYTKAKEFYERLDALYPEKKDLRKTYEYHEFLTGLTNNKYRYERRSEESFSDTTVLDRSEESFSDTMVLEIPLMCKSTIPVDVPDAVPDIGGEIVVPDAVSSIPVVVPDIGGEIVVPDAVSSIPVVVPDIGGEITLPVLADEVINEIIADLSRDPDIAGFLDDILTDDDNETLLERELTALGF